MGKAELLENVDIDDLYIELKGSGELYDEVREGIEELSIEYEESKDHSPYTKSMVMEVSPEKGLGGVFEGDEAVKALEILLE